MVFIGVGKGTKIIILVQSVEGLTQILIIERFLFVTSRKIKLQFHSWYIFLNFTFDLMDYQPYGPFRGEGAHMS